jgi:glycosyltransferase involved in cell wall biosynthesis
MARVVRRVPTAKLLLVGSGPEEQAIRQQITQLGLGQSVRFLGLRKDVARLLAQADLFLLTSISEGIPLTIIEAMCAGVPVVCTRVGGVPEVVIDGETGLTAAAGDDEGLAAAVLRLAEDPAFHQQAARRAAERACALFREDQMANRYLELYREMSHA